MLTSQAVRGSQMWYLGSMAFTKATVDTARALNVEGPVPSVVPPCNRVLLSMLRPSNMQARLDDCWVVTSQVAQELISLAARRDAGAAVLADRQPQFVRLQQDVLDHMHAGSSGAVQTCVGLGAMFQ